MARSLHKKSAAKSAKAAKKVGKTVGAAKSAGAAKQGDALVEKLRRYIRLHGDKSTSQTPTIHIPEKRSAQRHADERTLSAIHRSSKKKYRAARVGARRPQYEIVAANDRVRGRKTPHRRRRAHISNELSSHRRGSTQQAQAAAGDAGAGLEHQSPFGNRRHAGGDRLRRTIRRGVHAQRLACPAYAEG